MAPASVFIAPVQFTCGSCVTKMVHQAMPSLYLSCPVCLKLHQLLSLKRIHIVIYSCFFDVTSFVMILPKQEHSKYMHQVCHWFAL